MPLWVYLQGDLSTLESISTFTLQNAFQRFDELGLIVRRKSKKVRLVGLNRSMDEEALNAWSEKIGAFRREGKSRRTNALGKTIHVV